MDENGQAVPGARLFVGDYQERAVPVADTDPATPFTNQVRLVPGSYTFIAQAPGFGHARLGAPEVRGPVVKLDHLDPQTNHVSIP